VTPGPGMARSVSGGSPPPSRAPEDHFKPLHRNDLRDPPLSVGASAPPPVRDQGPGRSLPGPARAIPCKVRVSHDGRSWTCPLRARSAGQRRVFAVTPRQPDTPAHLRTRRLTRCANRSFKQRVTPYFASHKIITARTAGCNMTSSSGDLDQISGGQSHRADRSVSRDIQPTPTPK
jgi:hypothetical protein